ncbi:CPBP family intramembrane glutamic endopeptidase [Hymenobacter puniceus]|uniref:CPBP family intramembrane glutamic endopeptidase n=1 Tax=Hymenobacter sp. BT190 TaxID=2763505 RepID=UPI001651143A|nr:type II CAAX endopeptidase family protein [Hymenobacter sp. BT190]MBC6698984.1 CPBP family intramembrane metalloprotease [Hymenobacter sp. BT190]
METIVIETPTEAFKPAPNVYPTIKESWGFLGWYLLVSLVVGVPVFLLGEKLLSLPPAVALLLVVVAGNGTLLWFLRRQHSGRWLGINLHGQVPNWLIMALPVMVLAADMILSLIDLLHLPALSSDTYHKLLKLPVVAFLILCVAAPVLEELLLRGVLLQGLLRNFPGRPWVAIGQSALIFGLMHANPPQSLATFLLGLLMGWLYYRTRSLWLCMGVHFLNNLFAFTAMLATTKTTKEEDVTAMFGTPWIYAAVVIVSALVLAGLLWRVHKTTVLPEAAGSADTPETFEVVAVARIVSEESVEKSSW